MIENSGDDEMDKFLKGNDDEMLDDNSIFDNLKTKGKIAVSITIDKTLLDMLNEYKKQNDIKDLSPVINAMLADWIKKNKNKKVKKK